MKLTIKTIIALLVLGLPPQLQAQTKYGNYKDSRIGDVNNETWELYAIFQIENGSMILTLQLLLMVLLQVRELL
ncbi:hypothetical protein JCM19274_2752 [Algibacter lectus]|uniref:Uncharacterized protein n=1 Tax=Algibacter lectus TaxID=221126 RepID=A0A090WYK6_9FLAO|nr:hypothetical protein [Algibacter lectus]GAL82041.1 hypothetical protein JCM19274_2752 [Algibacter lectus]